MWNFVEEIEEIFSKFRANIGQNLGEFPVQLVEISLYDLSKFYIILRNVYEFEKNLKENLIYFWNERKSFCRILYEIFGKLRVKFVITNVNLADILNRILKRFTRILRKCLEKLVKVSKKLKEILERSYVRYGKNSRKFGTSFVKISSKIYWNLEYTFKITNIY